MANDKSFMLPQEQRTVNYYNRAAQQWSAEHNHPGYWQVEMDLFHQLLPRGRILEIGSGGGRDAKELIALGYQYIGTDISTGLLEVARQALPEQTFIEQSVYDLSFDEPFDGFWASAVLLHIPRPRVPEALSQIRSTQRSGGVGFISLKDGVGEEIETKVINDQELHRHFTYWTREEFEPLLTQAGFKRIDYIYHPHSSRTRWHSFFVKSI